MALYAIDGRAPSIAPDAWVAPSADLIGEVIVGPGASIWFNVVIRADNTPIEIGGGTNVQDGAVLHSDPDAPLAIGAGCTIGHKAILHGCRIADDVLVGMGATILNHAEIGRESLVGANALITEGKAFEGGSLILGSPAKRARALEPAEIAGLRASAVGYVARGAAYRAGLAAIDQASGPE